jgi:hypothetical protein
VAGHELYAGVIIEALDRMRAPKRRSHAAQLDTKLTEAPLEKVSYVPVAKDMLQGSWSPLVKASPATRADPGVERVWTTTQAGDELRFRFRGRSVALYEVLGGGGAAAYHDVDGSSIVSEARCLRAGERPHLRRVPIAEGLDADRVHEVVIKLAADPCRLSGARRPKPGDTPALRVAALLLEGELVEEGPGSTPSSTREVRQEKGGGA